MQSYDVGMIQIRQGINLSLEQIQSTIICLLGRDIHLFYGVFFVGLLVDP